MIRSAFINDRIATTRANSPTASAVQRLSSANFAAVVIVLDVAGDVETSSAKSLARSPPAAWHETQHRQEDEAPRDRDEEQAERDRAGEQGATCARIPLVDLIGRVDDGLVRPFVLDPLAPFLGEVLRLCGTTTRPDDGARPLLRVGSRRFGRRFDERLLIGHDPECASSAACSERRRVGGNG